MIRWSLTAFLGLLALASMQAQQFEGGNFYDYKSAQEAYYDSLKIVLESEGQGMEGTGYKSFQSHLRVWEPLVYPEGDYRPALAMRQKAVTSGAAITNTVPGGWKELGPMQPPTGTHTRHIGTGRVTSITFHPNDSQKMFAVSPTGGLYVSDDGGEIWRNGGTDFLPTAGVGSIVVNPFKAGNWIVSTGDGDGDWTPSAGIFRTTNGGKTWEDISTGIFVPKTVWNALLIGKLVMHPSNANIIYAATNKGLFRCGNASSIKPIWKPIIDKEPFNDIEFTPGDSKTIYASGSKIYRSTNGGANWSVMPGTEFTNIDYKLIKVNLELSPANPRVVYAAVTGIQKKKGTYKAQLYRYDYNTNVWEHKGRILDRSYMPYGLIPGREKAFAVSPTDVNLLFASNVNPVVVSEDGGSTWTPQKYGMHDDIHHLVFSGDGSAFWSATDGGIYKSIDGGQTWANKTDGIGVANVHAISTSGNANNKVVIGTYDTGSSMYNPKTGQWQFTTGGDGYSNMIDHKNDSIVYTSAVGGSVWRNSDAWTTKSTRGVSKPGSGSDWQTWVTMDPKNPEIIYQCGKSLWRNTDRGDRTKWSSILNVPEKFPGFQKVLRAYVAPNDPNVIYAILLGAKPMKIVRTTQAFADNVGDTWEDLGHPEDAWVIDLAIDDEDPLQFWIAYSKVGNGFYNKVWKNNGKRWINHSFDLPEWAVIYNIVHEEGTLGRIYVGTSIGVFTTAFRTRRWTKLEGLPHCEVRHLVVNYATRTLLAGTFGRGVWECSLDR